MGGPCILHPPSPMVPPSVDFDSLFPSSLSHHQHDEDQRHHFTAPGEGGDSALHSVWESGGAPYIPSGKVPLARVLARRGLGYLVPPGIRPSRFVSVFVRSRPPGGDACGPRRNL